MAVKRVEVVVSEEILNSLSAAFYFHEREKWEAELTEEEREARSDRLVATLTIARVNGLSIKIWADEHPPPHFHVSYQGQEASFSIEDCGRLPGVVGLERYEHTIHKWWEGNRRKLIAAWNASRPTDCPVGPVRVPAGKDDSERISDLLTESLEMLRGARPSTPQRGEGPRG